MTIEFKAWPKIARLNRDMIVTEKIDGTNAAIGIIPFTPEDLFTDKEDMPGVVVVDDDGDLSAALIVYAQSRKNIITPEKDNFGFARWVETHAAELAETLGIGLHFGEWWGSGIQRGYGLTKGEKRFSLFNTPRYGNPDKFNLAPLKEIGVDTVPVLYEGPFNSERVAHEIENLRQNGSKASPGFMNPEGVVVFHTAAQTAFKVTLENDEVPKALAEKNRAN